MTEPRTFLVAGASGFIGSALTAELSADGHTVRRLVRREPASATETQWHPERRSLPPGSLDGVDVVINLAGSSISQLPWTPRRRKGILDSRIDATATIVDAIAAAPSPPAALLNASASGVYGDRADEILGENAAGGTGFLAGVTARWEAEALRAAGITRTVLLRTGIVLAKGGGAAAPLVPLTLAGLGSRLGTGRQWWPWISLVDEVRAIRHLAASDVRGPVNLVGPTPATSEEITRGLARVLHRPHLFALPAWLLRLPLQDAADELLLSSQRMQPLQLIGSGFTFTHESAESALEVFRR
ncbi:TIGR01777 family oxidoreductase [Agreia sp. COWG]|uniref:TIGR01777 family oxidoreductase n=1 Tax=Agreia sp. COWG TaxID=2773266 RepID=UPI0019290C8D|nr:TIGR01777 family oxidoreductase [Agreia sp. COWG]CAD5989753.1 Cell division inhibitor [Agreia sp. COWG]